jgi:hypothetical protein
MDTSASSDNVTHFSVAYLNKLKARLAEMQAQVTDQMSGQGGSADPTTSLWIDPVDSALSVRAGGAGASATFDAASALNTALTSMGGSVHDQLAWLRKVLGDMIDEITVTVNSFGTTESVNNEIMDKLISEFKTTIGAIKKESSSSGLTGVS